MWDYMTVMADMTMNTHEDVDNRGNPIHGIMVENLLEERLPIDMFINKDFLSFRKVFNNLDGDERAGLDNRKRYNAGRLLALAGASYIISYIDDDITDIPPHVAKLIELEPYGSWQEFFDSEFDTLTEDAYDFLCSFLFGMVLNREEDNNLLYDVHSVFDDLLYHMILQLAGIVHGIEDIFGIIASIETSYPAAYWYEYNVRFLAIDTNGPRNHEPQPLLNYLIDRGYIDGRQDNLRQCWRGTLRARKGD